MTTVITLLEPLVLRGNGAAQTISATKILKDLGMPLIEAKRAIERFMCGEKSICVRLRNLRDIEELKTGMAECRFYVDATERVFRILCPVCREVEVVHPLWERAQPCDQCLMNGKDREQVASEQR